MKAENFNKDKILGARGAAFVCKYLREISGFEFLNITNLAEASLHFENIANREDITLDEKKEMEKKSKHIESIGGEDIYALQFVEIDRSSGHWDLVWDKGKQRPAFVYDVKNRSLKIEVKTDGQSGQYLHRNNNHGSQCGTVGFQLWKWRTDKKTGEKYWVWEWLHHYFYPETQENYMEPTHLCSVQCLDDEGKRPFCVIFFEWDKLKIRLNELAHGKLWPEWKIPKPDAECWKDPRSWVLKTPNGRVTDMWHVELDKLEDIARIIMIDTPTDEEIKELSDLASYMNYDLMKTRLQYLIDHASGEIRTE